jgi:hypothetical protein
MDFMQLDTVGEATTAFSNIFGRKFYLHGLHEAQNLLATPGSEASAALV